jgi:hypothetical protein
MANNPDPTLYPGTSLFPGGLTEGPALEIEATPHSLSVVTPVFAISSEEIDHQSFKDFAAASLNEEFSNKQGWLARYYPYVEQDRSILQDLRHVDIRSMVSPTRLVKLSIGRFSDYTVGTFDGQSVGALENLSLVMIPGENWTSGTTSIDATSKWRLLTVSLATGINTFSSILRGANNVITTVDIETGFDDEDYLSIALPNFPLPSISLPNSSISFTSDPDGLFTNQNIATVTFDTSLVTLVNGNSEFRVQRRMIAENGPDMDMSKITAVKIQIQATAPATFKMMGIRLLDKNWKFGREDINTYFGEFQQTVSRNGDPAAAYERTLPILWRSADVPSVNDPQPINAEVGTLIYTGSLANTNEFSLYFREASADLFTQIDLNGQTMATLDGQDQPDLGIGGYAARPQADFDVLTQKDIDKKIQFDLERTPDLVSASWIQFSCRWSTTDTVFSIRNTEGGGYSFNLGSALSASTNYLFITRIEDNAVRMLVYPVSVDGQVLVSQLVFDSSLIDDSFSYKRRKGRFGWSTILRDGDAAIRSIRERGVTYAEYRTLPYASRTPINGVALEADNTADLELFEDFDVTDTVLVRASRERRPTLQYGS